MPLLLADLDNTLVDRSGAYRRWADAFAAARALPPGEADWLVDADLDGLAGRERLAARISERYGLADGAVVADELRRGLVEYLEVDPAVPAALDAARAAGWVTIVVTNGTVPQQERKLASTGLDRHVAGWVISEGAGVRKPDRAIFELAARRARLPLAGAWVIGDSADADIAGACRAGLASVWLRRGRAWTERAFAPTLIADTCPEAIRAVLAAAA
jgi:putative hydrolase of the HAD superfamily